MRDETYDRYPLSLPACHGRLAALRAALRKADDALASCVPYVYNVSKDATNAPWRRETAEGVYRDITGARALIRAELECDGL